MDEEKIIINDNAEAEAVSDDDEYEYSYEFVFEDMPADESAQQPDYRNAGIFDTAAFFKDVGAAFLGMIIGIIPAVIWMFVFGKTSPACYVTIPIGVCLAMLLLKRRCDVRALWFVVVFSAIGIYLTEFFLVWFDVVKSGSTLSETKYMFQRIFSRKLAISGYKSEPLYSAIFIIVGFVVSGELFSKRYLAQNPDCKSWLFGNVADDDE